MKEMDATWTQMVFQYQEHPRTKVMMIQCSEELLETLEENQVSPLLSQNFTVLKRFLD